MYDMGERLEEMDNIDRKFIITQFFVHLILRIIENPLTRAFANDYQLHQLRRPGDVVWDAVRDGDDEAPPPPRPVCLHSLLDDVPYRW